MRTQSILHFIGLGRSLILIRMNTERKLLPYHVKKIAIFMCFQIKKLQKLALALSSLLVLRRDPLSSWSGKKRVGWLHTRV